jgi:hypothetical protein
MLAPAAPALAGAHHRAVAFRPCHAGWAARRERPVHFSPAFAVAGVVPGYLPPARWPDEGPGPYPVGYDGSSATPTGYGVVYNLPPAQNPPPRILYVHRRQDFPRENGVIVIRGGVVSAAY